MKFSRAFLLSIAAATAVLSASFGTAAVAIPTIPDNHPALPKSSVQAHPKVTVTDAAGNPVTGPVHRGDTLLVHGTGFDPGANRGGFAIPVPPGVPNGVFVMYTGLPDHWKPSEGAPEANRKHPHDRMAWVMPAGTLEAIPTAPVDFRRSIARVAQPMNADGSFTARVVVDPPEHTPGNNWGIYVYAAAGSINQAEEIYIPIPYSAEPGPNTPKPASPDLDFDATRLSAITGAMKGGINPTRGAAKTGNRVTFSKADDAGDGIMRYRGTVTATAKYNAVEVAIANPWLEPRGDGKWAVTAEVSTAHNVGIDSMARREIGQVAGVTGEQQITAGGVTIGTVVFR
ncbi:hypothetical protein CMUST_15250 [Corynebacterium mustelae]|uniref:HtaA protein n=1 Tax=Corynebacterium mustelae TaxID=571915 RepID=A0A0G3H1P8_9CORY|nr:hypothetical protein [Corynebacterium mustelae]AKK07339.1 hypothetical protein CMUST_15250 [Corynebacterium mustelae]